MYQSIRSSSTLFALFCGFYLFVFTVAQISCSRPQHELEEWVINGEVDSIEDALRKRQLTEFEVCNAILANDSGRLENSFVISLFKKIKEPAHMLYFSGVIVDRDKLYLKPVIEHYMTYDATVSLIVDKRAVEVPLNEKLKSLLNNWKGD